VRVWMNDALREVGEADPVVTQSLDFGARLGAGGIPNDHHLDVGVSLSQGGRDRAFGQEADPVRSRGHAHAYERISLGERKVVVSTPSELEQPSPVDGLFGHK